MLTAASNMLILILTACLKQLLENSCYGGLDGWPVGEGGVGSWLGDRQLCHRSPDTHVLLRHCLSPSRPWKGGGEGVAGGRDRSGKKKSKRTNKKQKILQNFHLNKSMDFNYEAKCVLALTFFIVTFLYYIWRFFMFWKAPLFGGRPFPSSFGRHPPPPLGPRPLEPLRPAAVPTWIIAALLSRGPWSVCLSLALSTFYPGALVAQFRVSSHFYLEQKNKKVKDSPPPRRETAGKRSGGMIAKAVTGEYFCIFRQFLPAN